MKRAMCTLILICFTCSTLIADTLVVSKSGYYFLTQSSSGVPVLTKIESVINLDNPAPPTPPEPPAPTDLTDRAKAIRDVALQVQDPNRVQVAQNLSTLYFEIARKVRAGELGKPATQATIAKVVAGATNMLLVGNNAWKPVRDKFNEQWIKLAQEGGTDIQFATLLEEGSAGLKASVPSSQAQNAQVREFNLKNILEIIIAIMKLLGLLPAQAGGGL